MQNKCGRLAMGWIADFAHLFCITIQLGLVGSLVETGEGRSDQEPQAFLEIELLPAAITKGDELTVRHTSFQLRE
jgi:hypothetical protein